MTERTFLLLTGPLYDGQDAEWPKLPYAISATELQLIANGIVPASTATLRLTLNDVAEATDYNLPANEKRAIVNVGNGTPLAVAANVRNGVIVTANGEASNLVVWRTAEATVAAAEEGGWIILTAGMLQSRFSRQVYDLLTSSLIKQGFADPIPQILADVTERVRQAIRSGGTALGPVNTIPTSERIWTLKRAAADLYGSTNDVLPHLSKVAREEAAVAEKHFERIEEGKIQPETPTEVTEEAGESVPGPSFTNRRRKFTQDTEDGI